MSVRISCLLYLAFLISKSSAGQSWQQLRAQADSALGQKNNSLATELLTSAYLKLPQDVAASEKNVQIQLEFAQLFYNLNNLAMASTALERVRPQLVKLRGWLHEEVAACINLQARIAHGQRQLHRAEDFYISAKIIRDSLHATSDSIYASYCNGLGVLYNDLHDFDKSLFYHQTALKLRREIFGTENRAYAQSCNNLAALYWNLGRLDLAEPLALEAHRIRGRVSSIPRREYAISCVNLANISRDLGKYPDAEHYYLEARQIRRQYLGENHDDYIQSCDILADLFYFMKRYSEAEQLYLEAKDIRERKYGTQHDGYAQSCNNLAALYRDAGDLQKAVALAETAKKIWDNLAGAGTSQLAVNRNNLATIYTALNRYAEAESLFMDARRQWQEELGHNHPYLISNALSLASMFRLAGNYEKADSLYSIAIDAQQKQLKLIFAFTSEREKTAYVNNIAGAGNEYYSFYFSEAKLKSLANAYNFSLLRRNLILQNTESQRRNLSNSLDTSSRLLYQLWLENRTKLASLYSSSAQFLQDYALQLQQRIDSLEKLMARKNQLKDPVHAENRTWKDVQAQLGKNEAAIEFVEYSVFDGMHQRDTIYYAALVIRPTDRTPQAVRLFEKRKIDSLLKRMDVQAAQSINLAYTRGLKVKSVTTASAQLYDLVWKPLEVYLTQTNRVYFAATGLLHRVAYHALPIDSQTVLSDRFELIQLSTTAMAGQSPNDKISTRDSILLVGDIRYSVEMVNENRNAGFWTYLPGTANEIRSIEMAANRYGLKYRLLRENGANEAAFRNLDRRQSPALLHIATHGFFFQRQYDTTNTQVTTGTRFRTPEDPLLRSGLVLANANQYWATGTDDADNDNVLTAYEVANLSLYGTRLVTLSACETALGDVSGAEGVYGLQRAFSMAGAQYLLMSLWKVPDQETSEFMTDFYKNLFSGQSIEAAYLKTRKKFSKKYRREPYKWAAWVLIR